MTDSIPPIPPTPPPQRKDPQIEVEKLRLEVLQTFLSSPEEKTQISRDERSIIASLRLLSQNAFPISSKIFARMRPECQQTIPIGFLDVWLGSWTKNGIPLGRQGRKEEENVLSRYFSSHEKKEEEKEKKPGIWVR